MARGPGASPAGQGRSLRTTLKAITERAFAGPPLRDLGLHRMRKRILVLAYHNVVPDDHPAMGDRGLHLNVSSFREQLDSLRRTHRITTLDQAIDAAGGERPSAVITFDDAYRGALALGLPELVKRGLPATVFVAPGALGTAGFWWDRLAPASGIWDAQTREMLLRDLAGRDDAIGTWAAAQNLQPTALSEWLCPVTEGELAVAARLDGIHLAVHSWSHPNLAALPPPDLSAEIVRPLEWLRQRFDRFTPWLAYPYGLWSAAAAEAAHAGGCVGALAVTGGWWPSGTEQDRFALPRWNVPAGVSRRGFELRCAGFFCQ